jgi:hypothetical protein
MLFPTTPTPRNEFRWIYPSTSISPLGLSGTESTITEATTGLLFQSLMMMDGDECGAMHGMLGMGNRSYRRKPGPVSLCLPQIPHDLTRARTRAAEV